MCYILRGTRALFYLICLLLLLHKENTKMPVLVQILNVTRPMTVRNRHGGSWRVTDAWELKRWWFTDVSGDCIRDPQSTFRSKREMLSKHKSSMRQRSALMGYASLKRWSKPACQEIKSLDRKSSWEVKVLRRIYHKRLKIVWALWDIVFSLSTWGWDIYKHRTFDAYRSS